MFHIKMHTQLNQASLNSINLTIEDSEGDNLVLFLIYPW